MLDDSALEWFALRVSVLENAALGVCEREQLSFRDREEKILLMTADHYI